jgi:hypothetical protein
MENSVKYSIESSYDFEDIEREYPEQWVIVADGGDEYGTCTVTTFDIKTDKESLEYLIEHFNNPVF